MSLRHEAIHHDTIPKRRERLKSPLNATLRAQKEPLAGGTVFVQRKSFEGKKAVKASKNSSC